VADIRAEQVKTGEDFALFLLDLIDTNRITRKELCEALGRSTTCIRGYLGEYKKPGRSQLLVNRLVAPYMASVLSWLEKHGRMPVKKVDSCVDVTNVIRGKIQTIDEEMAALRAELVKKTEERVALVRALRVMGGTHDE